MADTFIGGKAVAAPSTSTIPDNPALATSDSERGDVTQEIKLRPYRGLFNLPPGQSNDKLEVILKWADPSGKGNKDEILERINKLNLQIGAGEFGESKLDKVYKYIKIYKTISSMLTGDI